MTSTEPEAPTPDPELESPAPAPGESRKDRARRYGRVARLYTGAFAFVGLVAVLVILVAKNTGAVKLDWAVGSTRASLVWIILAAAVLGWLIGLATAVVFHHRTRRR
ncbi:MAG TPA: LapA family protein [Gaiellaceae bacterium]|nr:LapA family protein [Gaiellaceae bacterium]